MDQGRFDRIAAALGGAATRRAGLRAALALLAGRAAPAAVQDDASAAARRGSGRGREREHAGAPDRQGAFD